jgi:23S rRNA pseudouridine1911/1915/1917 synthase
VPKNAHTWGRALTASFIGGPGRLDAVTAEALGVSRADVQRAIADGRVLVDGRRQPKSFRLEGGERIDVEQLDSSSLKPDPMPVAVVYRDDDLAVVSKPAGVVTHPTAARRTGTLVNRLLGMGIPLASGDDPARPGIVHRLDAGTSGLLVVASSERAREALAEMFRRHEVDRRYLALVRGRPQHDEFLIEAPLERRRARIRVGAVTGREAATEVTVHDRFDRTALVEARPRTGRTHQIRVHLSAVGHPIVGDRAYGGGGDDAKGLGLERPFLHSWRLAFEHPITGERIELEDALPDELARALRRAQAG